jgi:hypothetical protein
MIINSIKNVGKIMLLNLGRQQSKYQILTMFIFSNLSLVKFEEGRNLDLGRFALKPEKLDKSIGEFP